MSIDTINVIVVLAGGLLGGFLAGLLGIGGGVIYVTILSYVLADSIESSEIVWYIVANSAFGIFIATASASIKNIKMHQFYFKESLKVAIPALLTILGFSYWITQTHWYSKEKFTFFFVLILILFALRMFFDKRSSSDKNSISDRKFIFTGLLTGIFSALSGLGGGIIMIPFFSSIFKLQIKKAKSISLSVMPVITFGMSVFYALQHNKVVETDFYSIGYLLPQIALPLALCVYFSAPLGVKTANKLDDKQLKVIFAALILAVVARMIYFYFAK